MYCQQVSRYTVSDQLTSIDSAHQNCYSDNDLLLKFDLVRKSLNILLESLTMSRQSLGANKLRSVLSLLMISIGVLLIVGVLTFVTSMEIMVKDNVATLGDDVVFIQKWPWPEAGVEYEWWKFWQRPEPELDEVFELQERLQKAEASAFVADGSTTMEYLNSNLPGVRVQCVSSGFDQVRSLNFGEGRYFSETELSGGRNQVILGGKVAAYLFPEGGAVGKFVKIRGNKVEVIGVFETEGESMVGTSLDNSAVVPVMFARKVYDIRMLDPYIMVKAQEGVGVEELMDEIRVVMRSLRRLRPLEDDDFALNDSSVLSSTVESTFDFMSIVGWIIGSFSILVGGFGVATIMFASVKERTNQIGIQKALGARRSFIMSQFLFEAVMLTLMGGGIGILLVWLLSFVATAAMEFDIVLTFGNLTVGVLISSAIGVLSGIVPAYMASRLDPVEAIRK